MDVLFGRFLKKIGIEDIAPYEMCDYKVNSYDKINDICDMTIFPTKCFSYQDARRLLDAINNAPFKSIVKFKYKTLITSRDVLNLLNEEFKANTESNIPFPSYRAEKDSVVFYFYGKVHFDIFKPVLEIWEDLLDELDIIFDIKTEIIHSDDLVNKQQSLNEKLISVSSNYKERVNAITSNEDSPYRKRVTGNYVPVRLCDISENDFGVEINGIVFKSDVRTTRKGKRITTLFVYDHTDSITVTIFANRRNFAPEILETYEKIGTHLKIRGVVEKNAFSKDIFIRADLIQKLEEPFYVEREDDAEEKRVELHAHTKMSAMDGLATPIQYFEQAKKWGNKAMGITDHFNVQAFPDVQEASKKTGVKALYGCEMNIVEETLNYIYNPRDIELNKASYVIFDFETTGLSSKYDRIIEFGAVKFKDGMVCDTMDLLIDPERPLSRVTKELTHISDSMLQGKPKIKEALEIIREFIGEEDTILVTHNASFDIGFLNEAFLNNGYEEIKNPVIDTLSLSWYLFPDNKSHRLGAICRIYGVDYQEDDELEINSNKAHAAHRADYDAQVLTDAWLAMRDQLTKENMHLKHYELANLTGDNLIKNLRPTHATVFAKNAQGLKDLFQLVSLSCTDYLASSPRIPRRVLSEYRKNLLIGSSCFNGEVFEAAQTKGEKILLKKMEYYDFIEVQPPENYSFLVNSGQLENEDKVKQIIKDIVDAADKLGKICVATGDCHYLSPEDKIFRDVYIAAKAVGKTRHPLNPHSREKMAKKNGYDYENPNQHFRSTSEMLRAFDFLGKEKAKEIVVKNSNMIADMFEEVFPVKDRLYPPHIDKCDEKLVDLVWSNAKKMYGDPLPAIVKDRLDAELGGILKYGYTVQYYIASEIVRKINDMGFMVGSRGSVGSSLVATMADITEVNALPPHYRCPKCKYSDWDVDTITYRSGFDLPPMKCPHCGEEMIRDGQNIPFATFLGFKAEKVPDIDLNFSGESQGSAHNLTKVLLGETNVYRAGTIETVAEKTAYGYALGYYENQGLDPRSIRDAEITRLSLGCMDVKRTTGQHPGGIIVIPEDMSVFDFTPIQYPADDVNATWKTTHFDFHKIHDNVLKLDLLGHVDPTALKYLGDMTGIAAKDVPSTDTDVISLFSSRKALKCHANYLNEETGALGLPEFGTPFVRKMLVDTRPKSFAELLIISGLSHGTDVWNGNAQDLIANGTCTIKEVIGCRDDIMVGLQTYGVEPSTSFAIMERVRKGKRLTTEDENLLREHKVPEWYIESCNKIKYLFPKAHAVAYVMMALRVAWYKLYYPLEYYAVFFTTRSKQYDIKAMAGGEKTIIARLNEIKSLRENGAISPKEEEIEKTLNIALEMAERGYKIGIVDINISLASKFIVNHEKKMIIPPFVTIDNLGEAAGESVVEARNEREFISIEDLVKRTKLNQQNIDRLKELGALDGLPESNQMSLFDW